MLLAGLVVVAAMTTGCGRPAASHQPVDSHDDIALPADYSGSGPGTLKRATTLPLVDRRLLRVAEVTAKITYLSTSGLDGSQQTVTGTVFEPVGDPPEGGWPVIVFGHGTTGVTEECGPSTSPGLLGTADAIRALLGLGYIMVVPDYQGLGNHNTYHPYLDATTEGYNMIDAMRATKKLLPKASDKWVAFGVSQGGQASWAANELNTKYSSPDLDLVGSVSVSPAVNLSGLADLAMAGTLTPQQSISMVMILTALKKEHPDLNLDDYRRGAAQKNWNVLQGCSLDQVQKRLDIAKTLSPDDLRPAGPEAADRLRDYLIQMSALPRSPASAPMLVFHGDADQVVPVAWVDAAVKRACDMGDVVASFVGVGRGHGDFDPVAALGWMKGRFAGEEPEDTCNAEGGPSIRKGV